MACTARSRACPPGTIGDPGDPNANPPVAPQGIFVRNVACKIRDIVDGTSGTFLAGERCSTIPNPLAVTNPQPLAAVWAGTGVAVNGQAAAGTVTAADVRAAEDEAVRSDHRQYAVAAVGPDGAVLGYSTLFVRDSPLADSGQTVVLPGHRRRGLATLLKTTVIGWARDENPHLALLQAWNDAGNEAVRALNRRLGFEADQRWSTYRFEVNPEGDRA